MSFGQPVLDTVTVQPNGTAKLSNNKSLKLSKGKKANNRRGCGGGEGGD